MERLQSNAKYYVCEEKKPEYKNISIFCSFFMEKKIGGTGGHISIDYRGKEE
jgi:hypothetical protein